MDLSKCFDYLCLASLNDVCNHIVFDAGAVAIANYAKLRRVLFVDSQPTDVVLAGDSTRGIPQGCPIACALCNLYSLAWHISCSRTTPGVTTFSVLDDRLAVCNS